MCFTHSVDGNVIETECSYGRSFTIRTWESNLRSSITSCAMSNRLMVYRDLKNKHLHMLVGAGFEPTAYTTLFAYASNWTGKLRIPVAEPIGTLGVTMRFLSSSQI